MPKRLCCSKEGAGERSMAFHSPQTRAAGGWRRLLFRSGADYWHSGVITQGPVATCSLRRAPVGRPRCAIDLKLRRILRFAAGGASPSDQCRVVPSRRTRRSVARPKCPAPGMSPEPAAMMNRQEHYAGPLCCLMPSGAPNGVVG